MKKEVKEVQNETPNTYIFITKTEVNKNHMSLSDCVRFGFGFYVGFKLARSLKYAIIKKLSK